jgi:hypothetical protein
MRVMQGKGCGAEFTEIVSEYAGYPEAEAATKALRPDLPFVSWFTDETP